MQKNKPALKTHTNNIIVALYSFFVFVTLLIGLIKDYKKVFVLIGLLIVLYLNLFIVFKIWKLKNQYLKSTNYIIFFTFAVAVLILDFCLYFHKYDTYYSYYPLIIGFFVSCVVIIRGLIDKKNSK